MRSADLDSTRRFRRFVLFASILIVATIVLGQPSIQYQSESALPVTVAASLIGTPGESRAAPGRSADRRHEKSWQARHIAALPPRGESLRWLKLSVELDGDITHLGPDPARPPIVATWFTRPDESRQNVAPTPLHTGLLERQRHSSIRAWPDHATEIVAAVLPRAMYGEIELRELTVEVVSLSTPYRGLLVILVVGWAMLALDAARYVHSRFLGPAALLPLALAALIAAAVMFSSDVINDVVRPIVSLAHGTRAGVSLVATFKVGHAIAFALLTCSLLAVHRRLGLTLTQIIVLITLLAIASESVQLHIPARTAQLGDLGIDALGVLAGTLLWQAVRSAKLQQRMHLKRVGRRLDGSLSRAPIPRHGRQRRAMR